ncbi:aladin isoform X2 [Cinnamomum micranthum f. kanehirae]|uniref:Aladin isoform X2 n=1 Tax=Cinnamomum micranthum f. kanehirae TaxID=337451 RepID=A0A443N8H6_9MAGN|nr:aladin isoform X2 [Cinnamomum micranthum f. kanehirae]
MPSLPPSGSVTICEINRDFITSDALSDAQAKVTYGKVLGIVFSPVPFQSDLLLAHSEQEPEQGYSENVARKGLNGMLRLILNDSFKRVFLPKDVLSPKEVDLQGVSWHQHKHILAFISGPNQVTVRDYEDADGKDPCILTSETQRDIKMLDWRPNGGKILSVACKGGVCIWSASYPGNAASVRSGVSPFLGTLSRGSGVRWTLVDFLRSHDGLGTPIRRGLGGISMLKWSPTGDYFFTAKFDGTFYLWETNTWTSERWSSSGGRVTGAAWDPDGHMILIAFSESITLASIHFASKPPSLDAHLLPVDLPEIVTATGSAGIEKIAWDASGERLAVCYKGSNEMYSGLIAVYDTRRTPIVSASLIGFIRGPGENPKPLGLSFHDKFKQVLEQRLVLYIPPYFSITSPSMIQVESKS